MRDENIKAVTTRPIKAVADQPTQASQRWARKRPMTDGLVMRTIIIAMTGTETMPFKTALHTSILMGSNEVKPSANPTMVAIRMIA